MRTGTLFGPLLYPKARRNGLLPVSLNSLYFTVIASHVSAIDWILSDLPPITLLYGPLPSPHSPSQTVCPLLSDALS